MFFELKVALDINTNPTFLGYGFKSWLFAKYFQDTKIRLTISRHV